MIKSKTWVKDRYFEYRPGDLVKLVRKKENGHPRALQLGVIYLVIKVENDDLFLRNQRSSEGTDFSIIKVNKNYFVPIEKMRDEMIKDILGHD
jgi:hypothetical protein